MMARRRGPHPPYACDPSWCWWGDPACPHRRARLRWVFGLAVAWRLAALGLLAWAASLLLE